MFFDPLLGSLRAVHTSTLQSLVNISSDSAMIASFSRLCSYYVQYFVGYCNCKQSLLFLLNYCMNNGRSYQSTTHTYYAQCALQLQTEAQLKLDCLHLLQYLTKEVTIYIYSLPQNHSLIHLHWPKTAVQISITITRCSKSLQYKLKQTNKKQTNRKQANKK